MVESTKKVELHEPILKVAQVFKCKPEELQ
jgi:hypothetical protein